MRKAEKRHPLSDLRALIPMLLAFCLWTCQESRKQSPPPVKEEKAVPPGDDPFRLFDPLLADGFDFPVGDANGKGKYTSPDGRVHSGWYVAVRFAEIYSLGIHTGEDWNGRGGGDTDLGQPVNSIAKGRVLFAEKAGPPFGTIIQIEHKYVENGQVEILLSQYEHLQRIFVRKDQLVTRHQPIGTIGKGAEDFYPAHLHLELRRSAMATYRPEFWPSSKGWTQAMVRKYYESPSEFIKGHRQVPLPGEQNTLLVAIKHLRQMWLFRRGTFGRSFPIAIGQNPAGPKVVEGDNRLPEGEYHIVLKERGPFKGASWAPYPGPAWMKFDYPNPYDAKTGLDAGRINRRQYEAIIAAHKRGQLPPQKTPLDGGIGIHGWLDQEWKDAGGRAVTWGCISMHNKDLLELYEQVKARTPIYIWP